MVVVIILILCNFLFFVNLMIRMVFFVVSLMMVIRLILKKILLGMFLIYIVVK